VQKNHGDWICQDKVGSYYKKGRVVQRDLSEAVRFFLMTAEQDEDTEGQIELNRFISKVFL